MYEFEKSIWLIYVDTIHRVWTYYEQTRISNDNQFFSSYIYYLDSSVTFFEFLNWIVYFLIFGTLDFLIFENFVLYM